MELCRVKHFFFEFIIVNNLINAYRFLYMHILKLQIYIFICTNYVLNKFKVNY